MRLIVGLVAIGVALLSNAAYADMSFPMKCHAMVVESQDSSASDKEFSATLEKIGFEVQRAWSNGEIPAQLVKDWALLKLEDNQNLLWLHLSGIGANTNAIQLQGFVDAFQQVKRNANVIMTVDGVSIDGVRLPKGFALFVGDKHSAIPLSSFLKEAFNNDTGSVGKVIESARRDALRKHGLHIQAINLTRLPFTCESVDKEKELLDEAKLLPGR